VVGIAVLRPAASIVSALRQLTKILRFIIPHPEYAHIFTKYVLPAQAVCSAVLQNISKVRLRSHNIMAAPEVLGLMQIGFERRGVFELVPASLLAGGG
jgi:hypothetical protein